jgi:UDP-N-acetyl-D-galactosamine dehydrogenase
MISAGKHTVLSIRVAEAAKVIENTQRDLNIALANEFALIFKKMGLDTKEVLDAAVTNWKFLPFKPGQVGMPIQPGEISDTYANIDDQAQATGYQPDNPVEVGIANFVEWYKGYYKVRRLIHKMTKSG